MQIDLTDEEFLVRWSLEQRTNSKSLDLSWVASRVALRMLPLLRKMANNSLADFADTLKLALWKILTVRSGMVQLRFIEEFSVISGISGNSDQSATLAIEAIELVSRGDLVHSTKTASRAVYLAFDSFNSDHTQAAEFIREVRIDIELLNNNISKNSLFNKPLWTHTSSWWLMEYPLFLAAISTVEMTDMSDVARVADLASVPDMRGCGFEVWRVWYESIVGGRVAFNLKHPKTAEIVERSIALGGRDGELHSDFWDRAPYDINTDITQWVAEARAEEALGAGQGSGLRFQYRNGLIVLGKYLGLSSPQDDRKRIESNLPQLAELADVLQASLDARDAPYPPLLLKTVNRYKVLVKSTPTGIEPEHLHTATTLLRGQIESAARPSATSNAPPLEDGELALAKSITMISDLVVMGTARGRALFDDADRVSSDAGPDEKFINLSKELFELVKTHGDIMEGAAVDLLLDVLISGNLAPHPKRFAFLQEGSAKNALLVFGAIGLLSITISGVGALAFLADKLVDVGILVGGGYYLSKEARDKIDGFILQNENKLREIAKHKESLKWLDDVLYLREQHRKRRNDDLKK